MRSVSNVDTLGSLEDMNVRLTTVRSFFSNPAHRRVIFSVVLALFLFAIISKHGTTVLTNAYEDLSLSDFFLRHNAISISAGGILMLKAPHGMISLALNIFLEKPRILMRQHHTSITNLRASRS